MVRIAQQKDPRKVKITYEKPRWNELWRNNPRIAQPGEDGDFQELRPRDGYKRPYIEAKSDTLWTWKRWPEEWGGCAPRGELYFTDEELAFGRKHAGHVIVEHRIKAGASPNKQWGMRCWTELAHFLGASGIKPVYLGPIREPNLQGAHWLCTGDVRSAAAVIANAKMVIVHEGFLHHVAAAVGTPAIVIYGGYISPAITGYADQESLFTGADSRYPLGCGNRKPCRHCEIAMEAITPKYVAARALSRLADKVAA